MESGHGGDEPGPLVPVEPCDRSVEVSRGERVQRGIRGHHEGRPRPRDVEERVQQGCRAAFDRADLPERTVDQEILTASQAKRPEIRGE
jgi:hypothetical protein